MYTALRDESGEDPREVYAEVMAAREQAAGEEEDLDLLRSAAGRLHPG